MLKKIISRFFGLAPITLPLAATILVLALAACDSGGGGPEPGKTNPSSNSNPGSGQDVVPGSAEIAITANVDYYGTRLTIKVEANVTGKDTKKLDAVKIFINAKPGDKPIYDETDLADTYNDTKHVTLGDKNYCGDILIEAYAYVDGNPAAAAGDKKTVKNDYGVCAPSSSSQAPSSQSRTYSLVLVDEFELNSNGNNGIILSSGAPASTGTNIYLTRDKLLKCDANSNIVDAFGVEDPIKGWNNTLRFPDDVESPNSTSQFKLCPGVGCNTSDEKEIQWARSQYAVVCIDGAPFTEWSNKCYLIMPTTIASLGSGGDYTGSIKVWKVGN